MNTVLSPRVCKRERGKDSGGLQLLGLDGGLQMGIVFFFWMGIVVLRIKSGKIKIGQERKG